MAENVIYLDQAAWNDAVLEGGKVVVDFYSTECPPCEAFAAKFEPLSEVYGDHIKFVKIFRQENRALADSLGVKSSPTVLFYDRGKQVGETLRGAIKRQELIDGLDRLLPHDLVNQLHGGVRHRVTHCDLLIVGGGPAGLTAAIYGAQAHLNTILVDKQLPGGQVSTTHQVSNFPGFVEPQAGFMLMHNMSEQARKAGADYRVAVDVTHVDLAKKEVVVDDIETIWAKKLILATGSSPNPLGIPGEDEHRGQGISYCATCDAKYYEGKDVIVVGGGNSATEEALFIARFARRITVVHQFAELQANKVAQRKAFDEPKINFVFEHEPRVFRKNDDGSMRVEVEDVRSGERKQLSADGVFVFVGMRPNLEGLGDELKRDDRGYVAVDPYMRTSVPGVFAVGDVAGKPYRQITIAVAEGTVAAITAAKELE